jgi:hypothetical protein
MIANTPPAPYFAVIFTSLRTEGDQGYAEAAERMVELARQQPGSSGWSRHGAMTGWGLPCRTGPVRRRSWRGNSILSTARFGNGAHDLVCTLPYAGVPG